MEKTVGLAYECDCMKASLSYSEKIEDEGGMDHRIELEIELRTIGGVQGGFAL